MIKIMVVDDELDIDELFKLRFRSELKSGDLHFEFAHSGEDALSILKQANSADIVLILSDINMPGMNGFDLLKKLKSDYPQLKVFMITAYEDAANYQNAKDLGADDYVVKPIDFTDLRTKILQMKK